MLDKIVVIPDSFKNTMESKEVAYIIKDKIKELNPEVEVLVYPIADGGEGTAVIFSEYLGLEIKKMKTTNAFGKEIEIECGSDGVKAVIDIASVVGFAANAGEKLDPSVATTYGIGKVIGDLSKSGHKKIYVGLGGSVTNDLGLGMMSALGVRFYNDQKEEFVPVGKTFACIKEIDVSGLSNDCEIICLSDVKCPLFGVTGAAKMFSKQKGASDEMVEELEENGKKAAKIISECLGDYTKYPGSGAAGGLGYSFKTFLNAEMNSGIDEIIKISNVVEKITEKTLIITGEGKFDAQSVQGKVISGVVEMAKNKGSKVIVIAGCKEDVEEVEGIDSVFVCSKLGRDIEEIKKTCYDDLEKATIEMYNYIEKKYL